jgi:predicted nucleic acid-binding protein
MVVALLLDTSVLIQGNSDPLDEVAISAVSIAELHFGALVVSDDDVRAQRLKRLAVIEEAFFALPLDANVARECGRLYAALARRGGKPRRHAFDLAIAATANVHGVPLLTLNAADLKLIDDLVDLRSP